MELENLLTKTDKLLNKAVFKSIKQLRLTIDKEILDDYIIIGCFNSFQMELLNTKTSKIKLSLDSLLKNKINHPELKLEDYKKIKRIISKPDEVKLSKNRNNCILLLKKDKKRYQVVVKATKDKKENFLTSFRFAQH